MQRMDTQEYSQLTPHLRVQTSELPTYVALITFLLLSTGHLTGYGGVGPHNLPTSASLWHFSALN